jgi:hypothetical protein
MNTWKRPNENHFCQTLYFNLTSQDNKKQENYLVLQHLKNSHHQHLILPSSKVEKVKEMTTTEGSVRISGESQPIYYEQNIYTYYSVTVEKKYVKHSTNDSLNI